MANRNTRIDALQIKDGSITTAQLATGVVTSLGLADSAYQKPGSGIPSSDMTTEVQTSLGLADSALQAMGAFTSLTDVPAAYTGEGLKAVRVNVGETGLEFYTPSDVGFPKTDVIADEVPSIVSGEPTMFDLAYTPATGTLQVYLNGLLQEAGADKDYTLATNRITFIVEPEVGDIVLANYIKA